MKAILASSFMVLPVLIRLHPLALKRLRLLSSSSNEDASSSLVSAVRALTCALDLVFPFLSLSGQNLAT